MCLALMLALPYKPLLHDLIPGGIGFLNQSRVSNVVVRVMFLKCDLDVERNEGKRSDVDGLIFYFLKPVPDRRLVRPSPCQP